MIDLRAIAVSVVAALLFASANILTKRSLGPGCAHMMVWVSALAVGGFVCFRFACKEHGLGITSAVVDSLITLVTVGWAVFVLRERLTTLQHTGLAFIVVGLVLVHGPWSGCGSDGESPASIGDAPSPRR
jgi:drug/metabolite transporter (DMT)-like permease